MIMQKPSLARLVLVTVDPKTSNGTDVAPAVITRVWSDTLVNLQVLPDGPHTLWQTSVPLFESREDVDADRARRAEEWAKASGGTPYPPTTAAYWPPRV